jgi:molybdopterin-guanine dinucleotide biosynthesis protein A
MSAPPSSPEPDVSSLAVAILAGGEATRLPGKLALDAGGLPMLARVYRNVSGPYPTYLSCNAPLGEELAQHIAAPLIADRWSRRGPLAGMLSVMTAIVEPWLFVVAGDLPFIDRTIVERLARERSAEVDAIVCRHGAGDQNAIEPLVAIYAREAFLREGLPLLAAGHGSPRPVIEQLRTVYVDLDDDVWFTNVNTRGDYERIRQLLDRRGDGGLRR